MKKGWAIGEAPPIPAAVPVDWGLAGTLDRSWGFHLLALDLVDPLLVEHAANGAVHPLILAKDIALDWWRWTNRVDFDDALNWYDMAVGLRAWRISYIVEALSASGVADAADVFELAACLKKHEDWLLPDDNFTAASNHGFFQAAGLVALSTPPGDAAFDTHRVATSRLRMVLETHFTEEGIHKEHSPDYHYFLLIGFRALTARGLLNDPWFNDRLTAVSEALSWFVKPDGKLASLGDSDSRTVPEDVDLPRPQTGLRAFWKGGYAVSRRGTGPQGSYLAQTLCYHSSSHKQVDDLSVIWTAKGQDVLIDAGRFRYGSRLPVSDGLRRRGYRYSDPRRIYCESARGHNGLEIAGAQDAREGAPYASALLAAQEAEGVFAVLGRTPKHPYTHTRLVIGDGDNFLILIDGIAGGAYPPRVRQRLLFAPEWEVRTMDQGLRLEGDRSVLVDPLGRARLRGVWLGQETPVLEGWRSPKANIFEPTPSAAFGARTRVMALGLAFEDFGKTTGRVRVDSQLQGRLTFRLGDGRGLNLAVSGDNLTLGIVEA
ncbi:heparinase II/III family protein [Brevundimonas sp.]|uniref:heparinase II/III domain-containing protein n=1 Tax=Brevundimonas sp. TaxID=1871086 RepID=UPI0028AAFA24|nr:heparinase II/III family protein [Brevundimonas sp.]